MTSKLKNSGFTLLENMIAITVLVIGITAAYQIRMQTITQLKSSMINTEALSEHRTLNTLIQSIPLSEAQSLLPQGNPIDSRFNCLPHPWGLFQRNGDGLDQCRPNPAVTTVFNANDWNALSEEYYLFARGIQNGSNLNSTLDSNNFNLTKNKLQNLGCLNCHGGGTTNPNFNNFTQLTAANQSFVTLFGLGSGLGRRLLRPNMNFPSLRSSPSLKFLNHNVQFLSSFRGINSNTPTPNALEWNCAVGPTPFQRIVNGHTFNPPCYGGILGGIEHRCERTVNKKKKINVRGCNWKTYYGCVYSPSSFDFCTKGVVRPGSQVFPASPGSIQQSRCQTRYPPATWVVSTSTGARTYLKAYRYWECWDPNTYMADEKRWDVSYQITTTWANDLDEIIRNIVTTGALK